MSNLLSVGDLIDQSWNLYRAQFRAFMKLSGWMLIIAVLNIIALFLYPTAGALTYHSTLTTPELCGVILYAITDFLISPLLGLWIFISVTQAANAAASGQQIQPTSIFRGTKNRYFSALVVVVLVTCMIILAQLITLGPGILFELIGGWMQNAVVLAAAAILMIVGAFISCILTTKWILHFYMASYANVIDGAQKMDALTRSKNLIQGRFWNVLVRVVLPKFVFILFSIFFITFISLSIQIFLNGSSLLGTDLANRMSNLNDTVLPLLAAILINPLIILSDVILYKHLNGPRT